MSIFGGNIKSRADRYANESDEYDKYVRPGKRSRVLEGMRRYMGRYGSVVGCDNEQIELDIWNSEPGQLFKFEWVRGKEVIERLRRHYAENYMEMVTVGNGKRAQEIPHRVFYVPAGTIGGYIAQPIIRFVELEEQREIHFWRIQ